MAMPTPPILLTKLDAMSFAADMLDRRASDVVLAILSAASEQLGRTVEELAETLISEGALAASRDFPVKEPS